MINKPDVPMGLPISKWFWLSMVALFIVVASVMNVACVNPDSVILSLLCSLAI